MQTLLSVVRGIATLSLTGLGVLVVLQGDGAGAHVLGSLLIGGGIGMGTSGLLLEVVDGRFPSRDPLRRH
ncbi:hypothetical protein [Capillimicrobium parvum]|uniref:Uncharacterized protein n=1 Tax=Capillimicrobium parvum TaxID=2884022 RepID=A0A9E6XVE9_9ACTN|nr:hypothetical protein [Capillimicrobium parvum]UGS35169.1 hypothetical protein DSM104329_01554 [Capillimicrobium parvum]